MVGSLACFTEGFYSDFEVSCVSKRAGQSSVSNFKKGSKNINEGLISRAAGPAEKIKGPGIVGRINSRTELVEAWR